MHQPTQNLGFSWGLEAKADEFHFVLSASPDLSVPIAEATNVTSTYYEYSGTLDYSTYYYWQVKALKEGSIIAWSGIGIFRTAVVSVDGADG